MTRDKVDELLKRYRFEVGRYAYLDAQAKEIERQINKMRDMLIYDVASIQSPVISDMPKGTSIGDPTQRVGTLLADGWEPQEIKDLVASLVGISAQRSESKLVVDFVSAWLDGLTERERWMIEKQVIDGEFWSMIIPAFSTTFGEAMSKDTLKRIRNRALEKIYKMAE